jgi:4-hydroxybenzoate polyprenyltransferase
MRLKSYLRLARPKQWVKQVLVLAPLLALGSSFSLQHFFNVCCAAIAFSLAASTTYFFNDFFDIEKDRLNPAKMNRPLASGDVDSKVVLPMAFLLALTSISISLLLPYNSKFIALIIISYLCLNYIYSIFELKRIGTLGMFIVAIGFPLRFCVGVLSVNLEVSWWALVMITQLALFMLAGKRFQNHKRQVENYSSKSNVNNDHWLLILIIYGALFLTTYLSFIAKPEISEKWTETALILSTIPVGLGMVRFLELTTNSKYFLDEDVTESMLKDTILIAYATICVVLYSVGRFYSAS